MASAEALSSAEVVELERRMQQLESSANMREDMAMVMAPHANWEEFIMPAPLSVAILGMISKTH